MDHSPNGTRSLLPLSLLSFPLFRLLSPPSFLLHDCFSALCRRFIRTGKFQGLVSSLLNPCHTNPSASKYFLALHITADRAVELDLEMCSSSVLTFAPPRLGRLDIRTAVSISPWSSRPVEATSIDVSPCNAHVFSIFRDCSKFFKVLYAMKQ